MSYIGNSPSSIAFLTDTFSGNASATAFTLSAAPATTSSILVAVSGVLQDPSTYSSVGTTLTFSAAPPSGTDNISVRFLGIPASGVTTTAYRTVTEFTATASQTTFSVPSYTVGFIDVYRNGVMLGSADYTATNGTTVVLATGATSGDLVEVISFQVSSVLNAIPASPASVQTSYLVDGSVTAVKLDTTGTANSSTYLRGDMAWSALSTPAAGNGPAFRAFRTTSSQSLTGGVYTKIEFNGETFDTASAYDNATNYRFTPQTAGYYIVSVAAALSQPFNADNRILAIYKNGSIYSEVYGAGTAGGAIATDVVYLNGSTDYVEGYAFVSSNSSIADSTSTAYFSGSLARVT
jgi:hypothetical protein